MIRKFKQEDTERVMQIWLKGNIDAHNFVSQEYWILQYEQVKEQLLQADIYVYEQNEKIEGFVGMMDDYLAGIFVDEKCRSMGIGRNLLEHMKEIYPKFSLNVYQQNQRAVCFYLKAGLFIYTEGVDEATAEADYTMIWDKSRER